MNFFDIISGGRNKPGQIQEEAEIGLKRWNIALYKWNVNARKDKQEWLIPHYGTKKYYEVLGYMDKLPEDEKKLDQIKETLMKQMKMKKSAAKKPVAKKIIVKRPVKKITAKVVPKKVVPKKVVPKKVVPKKPAKVVPKKVIPKKPVPKLPSCKLTGKKCNSLTPLKPGCCCEKKTKTVKQGQQEISSRWCE